MPFVLAAAKTGAALPEIEETRLGGWLCPYEGKTEKLLFHRGSIAVSGIAGINAGPAVLIPWDSAKEPNSAWVEIRILEKKIEIETDPLGTFPLWTLETESALWIGGEVKALSRAARTPIQWSDQDDILRVRQRPTDFSPYENIRKIRPGHLVELDLNTGSYEQRPTHAVELNPPLRYADSDSCKRALSSGIVHSMGSLPPGGGWGVFLSGGIDSSTAASLLFEHHPSAEAITLGTRLGNEYAPAAELAQAKGARHSAVHLSDEELLPLFDEVITSNEVWDGLTAEILIQLLALVRSLEGRVRNVLTGYGSDLLFGGMLSHQAYLQAVGVKDTPGLIERTCWTQEMSPFFAWAHDVRLFHLYWEPAVMNAALRIPLEMNFAGGVDKRLLRELAVETGWLKKEHAFRPKCAMTNGNSVNELLSAQLGIQDNYAYTEKTTRAWSILQQKL